MPRCPASQVRNDGFEYPNWAHNAMSGVPSIIDPGIMLPRDFTPPVDLRWPAYIRTERGEGWWIPTPTPGITERMA